MYERKKINCKIIFHYYLSNLITYINMHVRKKNQYERKLIAKSNSKNI